MTIKNSTDNLWDKVAETYSSQLTPYDQEIGQEVLATIRNLGISPKSAILELGSGSGHLSLILAQNGYNVTLLDQSLPALNQSQNIFDKFNLSCKTAHHDLFQLENLPDKFDVIWNSGVMEHFNDRELQLAFKQIKKKKPKYFFFIVPNPLSLPYLVWKFAEINQNTWPYGKEHLRLDYRSALEKSGFKIISKKFLGKSHTSFFIEKATKCPKLIQIYNELLRHNFVSPQNFYLTLYVCQPCSKNTSVSRIVDDTETITKKFETLAEITPIGTATHQEDLSQDKIRALVEELAAKNYQLNQIFQSTTWKILGLYKRLTRLPISLAKKTSPVWLRKKVKNTFSRFLPSTSSVSIPIQIQEEWNSWAQTRQSSSLDIFNFSVISWDFRFQRPQHLCRHLVTKGHRVFYIKNEFIPSVSSELAPFKVEKKSDRVYEITLAANNNLFIYRDRPSSSDKKTMIASLKNLLLSAKVINPVAKIDHPFWGFIQKEISMPSFYDCMDNHQGFSESGNYVSLLEKHLFENSDFCLVSSDILLQNAKENGAKNTLVLKNAGDFDHFSPAFNNLLRIPVDIENLPHPIIGYYGAIADWFDTEILETMARQNPKFSIVLIGQVSNSQVEKIAAKHHNVHLLGEKKYSDLPAYLQCFDVCLIPFVLNDLTRATHPVKIFEYFAAGKPVVSTAIPEILTYKKNVYFADKKNFSGQIRLALKEPRSLKSGRQLIAQENTWSRRAELLNQKLNYFFPKVSIILLVYNNPDLTQKTIDSIINRSFYPNIELIIVDNASGQPTRQMLRQYSGRDYIKLIFNRKNLGFSAGNNVGQKKATGDYLILINNDVLVTPGWISRLIFHASRPGVGLVGPVTNNIGNEAKIKIKYRHQIQNSLETAAREYTAKNWGSSIELDRIAAFCWIQSREIFNKIGFLDERFGRGLFEDDDYCYRVRNDGLSIICADDVFVHHFGGASFKKLQSKELNQIFQHNKELFEKKWDTVWIPHRYRNNY